MPSAVFGDIPGAAREHLEAAIVIGGELPPVAVVRDLRRLLVIVSRLPDDLLHVIEAAGRSDLHAWERAVIDQGEALRPAAGCLSRATSGLG